MMFQMKTKVIFDLAVNSNRGIRLFGLAITLGGERESPEAFTSLKSNLGGGLYH